LSKIAENFDRPLDLGNVFSSDNVNGPLPRLRLLRLRRAAEEGAAAEAGHAAVVLDELLEEKKCACKLVCPAALDGGVA
jgi:hypothetical protein